MQFFSPLLINGKSTPCYNKSHKKYISLRYTHKIAIYKSFYSFPLCAHHKIQIYLTCDTMSLRDIILYTYKLYNVPQYGIDIACLWWKMEKYLQWILSEYCECCEMYWYLQKLFSHIRIEKNNRWKCSNIGCS